jgi:hypothetical protein
MSIASLALAADNPAADTKVPLGRASTSRLELDLAKLMAGRCLIQGSSGAGKSQTLRRIIEEAFDYLTTIIVDPEGEFTNLAEHIGATTILARDYANDGLTALRCARVSTGSRFISTSPTSSLMCVSKKRQPSLPDSSSAPREHWGNTVLVCIDEAHLLAPHMAASARDAETRRLGVATLTDMCARGRKRGIGTIIATQRLAKLASSVVSELHNHLIGLNVFDRDVARAADLLGFGSEQAGLLRQLAPGEFFAFGPALSPLPQLARIDPTITRHIGHSPALLSAADLDPQQSRSLLDLEALRASGAGQAPMAARGTGCWTVSCLTLPRDRRHASPQLCAALRRMPPPPRNSPAISVCLPRRSMRDWTCSPRSAPPTRCRAMRRGWPGFPPGCVCG